MSDCIQIPQYLFNIAWIPFVFAARQLHHEYKLIPNENIKMASVWYIVFIITGLIGALGLIPLIVYFAVYLARFMPCIQVV